MTAELESGAYAEKFESGAFSVVFRNAEGTRAFKLFWNQSSHPDGRLDKMRRAVFASEVAAYQLATKDDLLKLYVPAFYGPTRVVRVIDGTEDWSNMFLLDCCYEMELVAGHARKLGQLKRTPELATVLKRFDECGIEYVRDDASINFPGNGMKPKFIDFATKDVHGNASLWLTCRDLSAKPLWQRRCVWPCLH